MGKGGPRRTKAGKGGQRRTRAGEGGHWSIESVHAARRTMHDYVPCTRHDAPCTLYAARIPLSPQPQMEEPDPYVDVVGRRVEYVEPGLLPGSVDSYPELRPEPPLNA